MRTVAMAVVAAGCAAMAAGWMIFLVFLVIPMQDEPAGPVLLALSIVFLALFGLLAVASALWSGARIRAGFWLVPVVLAALVVLINAPYIPYALAHPAETSSFVVSILIIASGAAIAIGGVAAFLDVRRGRPTWSPGGRAGQIGGLVVALVIGAAATSALSGSVTAAGSRIATTPTSVRLLAVENTRFEETSLAMSAGGVLGLFVINEDASPHAFDIDSLGIHVQLASNSTTALVVAPTAAGVLEFYCSVPGHRDAGMVGTIAVK
jgi:plastocyanin